MDKDKQQAAILQLRKKLCIPDGEKAGVIIASSSTEQFISFGPFFEREDAQRVLEVVAGRPDIKSALIFEI